MKNTSYNGPKSYSYAIDIYKFLLTVGVCLMHYEGIYFSSDNRRFDGFYLAVDFFFVLSGFFLYKSVTTPKYDSAYQYTKKRAIEFMGYNVIMLMLFILKDIYACVMAGGSITEIIVLTFKLCMNGVYELLFLQMFLPSTMYNFPIWYISILLVVGYCMYLWLKSRKNAVQIMPIICVVTYMLLYTYHETIDLHIARDVEGLMYRINPGIFRGGADMCLGVIGYHMLEKRMMRGHIAIRILVLGMMSAIIGLFPHTTLDFVFPFLAMVCIVNEFAIGKSGEASSKLFMYLRKISLGMYFVHVYLIRWNNLQLAIFEMAQYNEFIARLIELVVIIIGSVILELVITMLKKAYCHVKKLKKSDNMLGRNMQC